MNVIFIKSTVYVSYIVPSTEPRFLSGKGRGRLFQILSLRKGANSKRGAYLKLTHVLNTPEGIRRDGREEGLPGEH